MKKQIIPMLAFAFLLSAPAMAESDDGQKWQHKSGEMFQKKDTDGDGFISKDEMLEAHKERIDEMFEKHDKDGDGKLSKDELKEGHKAMKESMKEYHGKRSDYKSEHKEDSKHSSED